MENEIICENDKMRALELNPDTMAGLCEHVANGGDLLDLCDLWGVPFSRVHRWIYEDQGRAERFKDALEIKTLWSIERVIKELQAIALVDVGRAYEGNKLKPMDQIPEDVRRCIVAVESEEITAGGQFVGYVRRVKWSDKLKALETLGRRFALWIDRIKATDKGESLEDLLDATIKDNGGE